MTQHHCILCDLLIPHTQIFCAECDVSRRPSDILGDLLTAIIECNEQEDARDAHSV